MKKAGGAVVIENPATAMFPSMPSSIPPSLVDATADLDSIGSVLCDLLAAGNPPAEGPDHDELRNLLERIHERSGIDFSSYKPATILRRLRGRMNATSRPTLAGYAAYLESDPEEYARLVNSLLIKVTEFFRDPKLFEYLRANVLPELIAEARRDQRRAPHLVGRLLYRRRGLLPGHHRCRSPRGGARVAGRPDLRDGHRPRGDRLRPPGDLSARRPQGPARRRSRPLLREIGRRLRGRQTAACPDGLRRARSRRASALPADRSAPLPERADLLRRAHAAGRPRDVRVLVAARRSAGPRYVRDRHGPAGAIRRGARAPARLSAAARELRDPTDATRGAPPASEPGIPARSGHPSHAPRRPARGGIVGVGG